MPSSLLYQRAGGLTRPKAVRPKGGGRSQAHCGIGPVANYLDSVDLLVLHLIVWNKELFQLCRRALDFRATVLVAAASVSFRIRGTCL